MAARITNADTPEKISTRKEFSNSTGSFRGEINSSRWPSIGRLPSDETYKKALNEASYIVYSYGTPILWFAKGTWYYPEVKYSITTSAHQSKCLWGAQMSGKKVVHLGESSERKKARRPSSTGGGWAGA